MMGILNSIISADAALAFMDPNGFGESIIYTPYPAGVAGTPKTIIADIERQQQISHAQEAAAGGQIKLLHIQIANHATAGVTSVNLEDKVEAQWIYGGPVLIFRVKEITNSDPGMWQLLIVQSSI